jgi:hypothetical protein
MVPKSGWKIDLLFYELSGMRADNSLRENRAPIAILPEGVEPIITPFVKGLFYPFELRAQKGAHRNLWASGRISKIREQITAVLGERNFKLDPPSCESSILLPR